MSKYSFLKSYTLSTEMIQSLFKELNLKKRPLDFEKLIQQNYVLLVNHKNQANFFLNDQTH